MKYVAIINEASGSVEAGAAQEVEEIVRSFGHDIECHVVNGDTLMSCIDRVCGASHDRIIAWGGDGTLAAVLNACGETGVPVLPLPGGTMNLLVKRIHGRVSEWRELLKSALERDDIVSLPAITANERRYYVGMLVGKLTQLTRARENLREGAIDRAVAEIATNDVFNFETELSVAVEEERSEVTAAGVFVPEDSKQKIELITIDPDSLATLLKIGLDALYGSWKASKEVEVRTVGELMIATEEGEHIPVTYDGEFTEILSPIKFELIENAAQVMRAGPQ